MAKIHEINAASSAKTNSSSPKQKRYWKNWKPNNRKFFNNTNQELEEIFTQNQDNPAILQDLLAELSNRKKPKAKLLAEKIATRLEKLNSAPQSVPPENPIHQPEPPTLPTEPHPEPQNPVPADPKGNEGPSGNTPPVDDPIKNTSSPQKAPGAKSKSVAIIATAILALCLAIFLIGYFTDLFDEIF